jgi:hypothetical protein
MAASAFSIAGALAIMLPHGPSERGLDMAQVRARVVRLLCLPSRRLKRLITWGVSFASRSAGRSALECRGHARCHWSFGHGLHRSGA